MCLVAVLALPLARLLFNHFLPTVRATQIHNLVIIKDSLNVAGNLVKFGLVVVTEQFDILKKLIAKLEVLTCVVVLTLLSLV